jgi:uncharacterized protein YndB with AHSA1/START domain
MLFAGGITGTMVEVVPNVKVVQKWRQKDWPEGVLSTVTLDFSSKEEGVTFVELTQEGIPEEDAHGNGDLKHRVEEGWKNLIFQRSRQVFGFGA